MESIKSENIVKKEPKRKDAYRFSLYLDQDLGEYVSFVKYKYRITITDFLNKLVRDAMEKDEQWK